jgi:hypothetical protein
MKKTILTATALATLLGFATAASAAGYYVQGGPTEYNGTCQVTTDGFGNYGFVTECPRPAMAIKHRHSMHIKHMKPVEKPQS